MSRLFLFGNAVLYYVFSIWCTLMPEWTASAVGFSLPGKQGYAEYLAVYGGLQFGVATFFLLAALQPSLQYAGILFGACFYTAIFAFRTIALTQTGLDIGAGLNFYMAEGLLMVWSLFQYRSERARA